MASGPWHSRAVDRLRTSLRDKAIHVVDEVVSGYHRRQTDSIESLRQQVSDLRSELDRVGRDMTTQALEIESRGRRDVSVAGEVIAAQETAKFVSDEMATATRFGHPHATLEHALSLAPTGGMALEFGVYSGTTLTIIAKNREGEGVYGFDSFKGLPELWRGDFPAGTFAVNELPSVPGAELVVGWFDETLPGFLAEHPGPVDFLHVDADLYSAAKTVLELVGPRLREGSVIVFDEFFNYPGWQAHEYRAWQEYLDATGVTFSYEAYTHNNEQVAVKMTTVQSPGA